MFIPLAHTLINDWPRGWHVCQAWLIHVGVDYLVSRILFTIYVVWRLRLCLSFWTPDLHIFVKASTICRLDALLRLVVFERPPALTLVLDYSGLVPNYSRCRWCCDSQDDVQLAYFVQIDYEKKSVSEGICLYIANVYQMHGLKKHLTVRKHARVVAPVLESNLSY